MSAREISSFEAFHRLVPSIVKRMNEDKALALRAMANPILAVEEMGLALTPEVAREVELRSRFSEDKRKKLASLHAKIEEAAGESFNPESTAELERVLFTRLKLKRPADLPSLDLPRRFPAPSRRLVIEKPAKPGAGKGKGKGKGAEKPKLVAHLVEAPPPVDPLSRLKGKHPVVDLCIEYRAICMKTAPFATREAYEALKAKAASLPISGIKVRLPEHVEAGHA